MGPAEELRRNKHFRACLGSLNLGALCVGLALGWPRPAFAYLRVAAPAGAQPMRLLLDEAWIESMINAGAALGSLASILVSGPCGRRASFALSAASLAAFWLLLGLAGVDEVVSSPRRRSFSSVAPHQLIVSAALVAGLGVGVFSATAVLYVAEVSTLRSRGLVGSGVVLCGCLGVFAVNVLGYLFDIRLILSPMAALPLCFLASVYLCMIESPFYLFQTGAVLEAKIALKYLRDRSSVLEIDEEYRSMEAFFNVSFSKGTRQLLLESLCPRSLRPLAVVVVPVLCVSQTLGLVALSDYAEQLIESMYPYTGPLAISFIDVLSTGVACVLAVERIGRKALLIVTIVGSSLCCFALAICNLAQGEQCYTQQLLADQRQVLPSVILCVYYAIYALGFTPVLPIVTGEMFPGRAKTAAVGLCACLLYSVAFCMRRTYMALNRHTSSCFAFVCFAIVGSIGLPCLVTMLPEAKGQSLLRVQTELENGVVVNY